MQTPPHSDRLLHDLHHVMQKLLQNVKDEQWQQVEIADNERKALVDKLATIQAPLSIDAQRIVGNIFEIDQQVMALTLEARRAAAEAMKGISTQKTGCRQYVQNQNIS